MKCKFCGTEWDSQEDESSIYVCPNCKKLIIVNTTLPSGNAPLSEDDSATEENTNEAPTEQITESVEDQYTDTSQEDINETSDENTESYSDEPVSHDYEQTTTETNPILHEALKSFATEYGDDIFDDPNKTKLVDLVTTRITDSELKDNLLLAIHDSIGSELFNSRISSNSMIESRRNALKKYFQTTNNLEIVVANYIIDSLAYGIGLISEVTDIETQRQQGVEEQLQKEQETANQFTYNKGEQKKSGAGKKILFAILILAILGCGGFFGKKYLIGGKDASETTDIVNNATTQEETPSVEHVDNSKWVDETPSDGTVVENEPTEPEIAVAEPVQVVEEEIKPVKKEEVKPTTDTKPVTVKAETPVTPTQTEREEPQPKAEIPTGPVYKTINYPSGETYQGYVNSSGLKHGIGTYMWRSGNKYVGDWVNDKATGQGIYYSSEGWRYEGGFINAQFHGKGIYYFANGKKKEGTWSYGKMQTK